MERGRRGRGPAHRRGRPAGVAHSRRPERSGRHRAAPRPLYAHACPPPSSAGPSDTTAQPPLGRRLWIRLIPLGLVLLVVSVVDSTVSAWSAVYLRQTLAASLTVAPLAYAAYQAGTVAGRAATDRLVQRFGAVAVVRTAALLVAAALAGMAAAPSWPFAVLAAGAVGLGASSWLRCVWPPPRGLRPAASEAVLARLNLFNYVGVIVGGAVSGLLGPPASSVSPTRHRPLWRFSPWPPPAISPSSFRSRPVRRESLPSTGQILSHSAELFRTGCFRTVDAEGERLMRGGARYRRAVSTWHVVLLPLCA